MQVAHDTGHLSNLLRMTVEESADLAVRQVAAISLKNLVKNDWECGKVTPTIAVLIRGYRDGFRLITPRQFSLLLDILANSDITLS